MSDELNALQETAAQARAKANELKAALTDASSDEERTAAQEAETAATDAESAFAEATAKAGTDSAAQSGKGEIPADAKVGDACTCPDGRPGTVQAGSEEGTLVCLPNA
jgi:hypothetical protein